MNVEMFKAKSVSVDVEGVGPVSVKQLTTKEYHAFMSTEDPETRSRQLIRVSLGIDDATYDEMPMAILPKLVDAILRANDLHKDQHKDAVKN